MPTFTPEDDAAAIYTPRMRALELQIVLLRRELVETQARVTDLERQVYPPGYKRSQHAAADERLERDRQR